MLSGDYYAVLCVSPAARQDEIKTAFRKAALKWHPDKNPSPQARHRFMEAYEAYEILADPWKRKIYDGQREVSGGVNPEYDEWARSARNRARHYTEVSYEEFWEDVRRDVRTIFFGSELPDAHEMFIIFGKMFLLVSGALGVVTAPFSIRAILRAVPIFLLEHMHMKPAAVKIVEVYGLSMAGLAALFLFTAAFVISEFFEFSWRDSGARTVAFFFTVDDRIMPLAPCFFGATLSLIAWLLYFLAV